MSQPSMSRALQRLRGILDDELLVRAPGGYQLTPRAERTQRELLLILPRLESLFSGETFDPRTAAQTFRLTCTDYFAEVLCPPLLQRLLRESPQSTVRIAPWSHTVHLDLLHGLSDLAFVAGPAPATLRSEPLYREAFVCLLAREHPLAGCDRLTLAQYLDCSHAVISILDGQQGLLDHRLEALGVRRRVGLTVPYHAAAAAAIPGTKLVATLPARLLPHLPDRRSFAVAVAAPIEIEPMSYSMLWHPRLDDDPAHRWLRDLARTTASAPDA